MTSSRSSQKRTAKSYFEEISSFDLFYQLTYMSATSAAGISRARTFQLARELQCPPARYFKSIHEIAENLRYNYPDAVRLVGEQAKSEDTKTFLLRLSDALRSGEPLPEFLKREAEVQGEHYANDYLKKLESMKKWTDGYAAINVSVGLVVIINMVMTMIYNVGATVMTMMAFVAVAAAFAVAWTIFRAAPPEVKSTALATGSKEQRRSRKLFLTLTPLMMIVCLALFVLGVSKAWVLIVAALFLAPIGWFSNIADKKTSAKDAEISAFLRSLGGTATSRGTTLKVALSNMKIDSFPTLRPDIRMLDLRLKSFIEPKLCWKTFRAESGSKLVDQTTGIFYEAINLGGDAEKSGNLTSTFAMKTAMLRAQRTGVAATFSWLTIAMHAIMAGLMVFLLGILEQFGIKLNEAMSAVEGGAQAMAAMGLKNMFAFNAPQVDSLTTITFVMIVLLALINAFAVVASEGGHLIKITFYLSILLFLSGLCFFIVPSLVHQVM